MTVILCCLIDRTKRHACNLGEFTNHSLQSKMGKVHSLHSANAEGTVEALQGDRCG